MRSRFAFVLFLFASSANALTWPDTAIRVEESLRSLDPEERRRASRDLASIGRARGEALVEKALLDPDGEVRANAAAAAVQLRLQSAIETVLPWFGDPDVRLRIAACDVAAKLVDDRVVAPLSRTLGDSDPTVRMRAAIALGNQTSKEAVAPLLGRLDDTSPNVRIEVIRALSKHGDSRAVVPLVSKAQDTAVEVKREALRALGEIGDPRAVQPLTFALRDPSADVKMEALSALATLRADDSVDSIAALLSDRNPLVRQRAASALGALGSARAAEAIGSVLGGPDDTSNTERTPLRNALLATKSHAITLCANVLARPKNKSAAASCAWVVSALRATALSPAIATAMRRGTLPTVNALLALRGIGNPADLPTVLEYLSDPNEPTRRSAIAAAIGLLNPKTPDGRAVDPIIARLNDSNVERDERVELATLLGRTGSLRAVAPLLSLLNYGDNATKAAALLAIGMLGPEAGTHAPVVDALFSSLSDADATIRFHASVALGNVGPSSARVRVLEALGQSNIERVSLLRSLPGLFSRAADDKSIAEIERWLSLSGGADRDALFETLSRAHSIKAAQVLERSIKTSDTADLRSAANSLALQSSHEGVAALRTLSASRFNDVAYEAIWNLGALGNAKEELTRRLADSDPDIRANSVAALARTFQSTKDGPAFARATCARLDDPFPLVRANVLGGLALTHSRCTDGSKERSLLANDPSDIVRESAARAIRATPSTKAADDERALLRCALRDSSENAANACVGDVAPAEEGTAAATVFVVAPSKRTPSPNTRYILAYPNGLYRVGTTDRRGAMFDPDAPRGELRLLRSEEGAQGRTR